MIKFESKYFFGIALFFAISLVFFGCISSNPSNNNHTNVTNNTTTSNNSYYNDSNSQQDTNNSITKAMCDSSGGHWVECGSACRADPKATICTMNCVQYCVCGGIAGFGCPAGFVCTDYLPSATTPDAMGVCKKASS